MEQFTGLTNARTYTVHKARHCKVVGKMVADIE